VIRANAFVGKSSF